MTLKVPLTLRLSLGLGFLMALLPRPVGGQGLPESSLAVRQDGGWHTWWRGSEAPASWSGALVEVAGAVEWTAVQPGMEVGALEVAGDGSAWRLDVALVRLDPHAFRLALADSVRDGGTRGAWSLAAAPLDAALAVNAGQFTGGLPWGWVVRDGRELRPPGTGPLSMALVVDAAGGARLLPVDSIAGVRADGSVVHAFQSYPALLLEGGSVPEPLRAGGRGVDVTHRDSRLAIGELRDGRILFALTRFGGLGPAGASLPFGPTSPEMAALMGALGCAEAMLLDGGLSAQLLVRDGAGEVRQWKGWRRVPLALVAFPDLQARAASAGGHSTTTHR